MIREKEIIIEKKEDKPICGIIDPEAYKNSSPVKYIEEEYPETAKSFKAIQKEQYELET